MWDCPHCGCMNIIVDKFCPMCFKPRDVATEPGQPSEGSPVAPVGSQTGDAETPPSGNSDAAPSSPKSKAKTNQDWGKE